MTTQGPPDIADGEYEPSRLITRPGHDLDRVGQVGVHPQRAANLRVERLAKGEVAHGLLRLIGGQMNRRAAQAHDDLVFKPILDAVRRCGPDETLGLVILNGKLRLCPKG